LAYSPSFHGGGPLGTRDTFAVIGATIAENFGVPMPEGTIGEPLVFEE
jgi:phosphopentomutase